MTSRKTLKPKPVATPAKTLRVYQGLLIREGRLDAFLLVAAPTPKEAKRIAAEQLAGKHPVDALEWTEIEVTSPRMLYAEVRDR